MNIYNDQRLVSFSALNGFTGLCLGQRGLNVLAGVGLLSGAALGGSYWVVNSFVKDRLLNLIQSRVGTHLDALPEDNSEKFVFIAAHVADFVAKAFIASVVVCSLSAALPLSSAMITLGVSQLLYLFFKNLPEKAQAIALFVENPVARVIQQAVVVVESVAVELVDLVEATAEYVYSQIPTVVVDSTEPIGTENRDAHRSAVMATACG